MKLAILVPAMFALTAGAAYGQQQATGVDDATAAHATGAHPDFATADTDKDGLLSISELQAALPEVSITDSNADGFVNQSEAEAAISGLAFESSGYTGGSSLVSEPEYGLLVSTLNMGDGDAAAGAGDAVDSGESRAPGDDGLN